MECTTAEETGGVRRVGGARPLGQGKLAGGAIAEHFGTEIGS